MRYKNFTIKLYDLPFLESIKPLGISTFARALLFRPCHLQRWRLQRREFDGLGLGSMHVLHSRFWWMMILAPCVSTGTINHRAAHSINYNSLWETHALDAAAAAAQVASYIILYKILPSCTCHARHSLFLHAFYGLCKPAMAPLLLYVRNKVAKKCAPWVCAWIDGFSQKFMDLFF